MGPKLLGPFCLSFGAIINFKILDMGKKELVDFGGNGLGRQFFWILSLVLVGFLAGWLAKGWMRGMGARITYDNPPLRVEDPKYKLISPLYACGSLGEERYQEFDGLRSKIANEVKSAISKGSVSSASVYFRDLGRGRWVAINDEAKYFPASLLKVPLMITYFKQEDDDPGFLDRTLVYDGSFDDFGKQYIPPAESIEKGEAYTLDELVRRMIVYSDNKAVRVLVKYIDSSFLAHVYDDLGLKFLNETNDLDAVTVRDYSYFFRVLYNGTYLSKQLSEKALEILTQADFPKGIRSGVAPGVKVAEKFGQGVFNESSGDQETIELHDCGIVYGPGTNYLLCVMTKGNNTNDLTKAIGDISGVVFKVVSSFDYANLRVD